MIFSTKNPNLIFFFEGGVGRGGGVEKVIFFTKNSNLKFFFCFWVGGGGG